MEDINYRQVENEDLRAVKETAEIAWHFTYKDILEKEVLNHYLSTWYSLESLENQIDNIKHGKEFFYVATTNNGKIVGYCNIGSREDGMELARLYLLPEYIGKGIGKKLLQLGEDFLKSKNITKYYCYVNKGNKIGIDFYKRNGFKNVSEKDLSNPEKQECQYYMEKTI